MVRRLVPDAYVLSYPKSGRTWLRLALGIALRDHFEVETDNLDAILYPDRLHRLDRRIPRVRFTHDDGPHLKRLGELERDKAAYRRAAVVLMVRDPRDVVVSHYFHQKTRASLDGAGGFEGSISEFIRHERFGIENVIEFMNIWARSRTIPRHFLLVRYEDMSSDMHGVLRRVLAFLDLEQVPDDVVHRAVEFSRFDNMQAMEEMGSFRSSKLRAGSAGDPDSRKVRRGRVGGYVNDLDPSDIDYVDDMVRRTLHPTYSY